jgi:hypothetical protein
LHGTTFFGEHRGDRTTDPMTWKKRLTPTLIAAILTVIATYALLRAYTALFESEPNPATVMYSTRVAMFWRLIIGSYAAAMVAALVFFLSSEKSFAPMIRALAWAVPLVAALIALQGIFLP